MNDENDDTSEGTSDEEDYEFEFEEEDEPIELREPYIDEGDDFPVPPYVPDDGEPPQPVGVTVGTNTDPPPDPLEAAVAEPVDERQFASVGVNTSNRRVRSFATMTEPEPPPIPANVSAEFDRYLQDLLSSVDKDTREADELLGQLARPPSVNEEKEEPVPVLDPLAAGVMKAVARGDHASAAALLQDKQTEDDRKEQEAKKNQIYRFGVRNKIPLRGAKGPLDPNAKGVEEVAPPVPEQGWNRPAPARRVSNSVAGIVAAPTFGDEQAGPSGLLPRVPIQGRVANLIKMTEDRERRINLPDIQPRGRSEQPPRRAGLGPGAHAQPPRPLGHFAEPLDRHVLAPPQVSSAKPRSRVITSSCPRRTTSTRTRDGSCDLQDVNTLADRRSTSGRLQRNRCR